MSRSNRFDLTDERISHLNACAAQGITLTEAARELGVRKDTLRNAAERQDMYEWLAEKFPSRQGKGGGQKRHEMAEREEGLRKLKPEQISAPLVVPDSPQVRWLTREWRVAA